MSRHDGGRPTHEISCKVQELQEILAAANQLERFPDCEVKEALKAEIAEYLNPTEFRSQTEIRSLGETRSATESLTPAETSYSSKEEYDADWSPRRKKKFFSWPILIGISVVAFLLVSTCIQCSSVKPSLTGPYQFPKGGSVFRL